MNCYNINNYPDDMDYNSTNPNSPFYTPNNNNPSDTALNQIQDLENDYYNEIREEIDNAEKQASRNNEINTYPIRNYHLHAKKRFIDNYLSNY